ncbi:MAG: chromate transporter [Chloroflexaceae bacterium]
MVALSPFLPGPASSQMVIALGSACAGLAGGVGAWLVFVLPSALVMTLFGLTLNTSGASVSPGCLHGLKVAAVALVAQAAWNMAPRLTPN